MAAAENSGAADFGAARSGWWNWTVPPWPWPPAAPQSLVQPINPGWSLINVTYNNSSAPAIERDVLQQHSYGRQIGRLMDALSVLVRAPAGGREGRPAHRGLPGAGEGRGADQGERATAPAGAAAEGHRGAAAGGPEGLRAAQGDAGALKPAAAGRERRQHADRAVGQPRTAATTASPISRVPTRRQPRLEDVAGALALGQHPAHRALDAVRLLGQAERMPQHHRHRQDRGERIGDVLAGDVGRRAVHRLVQPLACRRRARPKAACRSSRSASRPRRRGCRRTCCR